MSLVRRRSIISVDKPISIALAALLLGCAGATQPQDLSDPMFTAGRNEPSSTRKSLLRKHYELSIAIPTTRDPVFGVFTTDELGRWKLDATRAIPNEDGQQLGWILWVGESDLPVTWSELLPPTSSSQARFFHGSMVPREGFVYNVWRLKPDDVGGELSRVVSLSGGRSESFDYTLGPKQEPCPVRKVYPNFDLDLLSEYDDPNGINRVKRALTRFVKHLIRHPELELATKIEDAYWVLNGQVTMSEADSNYFFGNFAMRAMADFSGRALKYTLLTRSDEGMMDYRFLFQFPISVSGFHMKRLADDFAGRLTPHVRKKCSDWASGRIEEEARLERIRAELVEEMTRIRRARDLRRKLTIEAVEKDSSPD